MLADELSIRSETLSAKGRPFQSPQPYPTPAHADTVLNSLPTSQIAKDMKGLNALLNATS
jgi:hypothetical protein